jgi:Flp pilus assembly CpaF family ATPase
MSSYRTTANETTLLTALGKFIPAAERILLIEDTAEIQLGHENLVRFEARREQNGSPAVSVRDLLKAALRHRPDRMLLGEIRSGEAFDLLQLLNTGHSGTISTMHASSARQGLARFTSCVLQSGIELPYRPVHTSMNGPCPVPQVQPGGMGSPNQNEFDDKQLVDDWAEEFVTKILSAATQAMTRMNFRFI